MGMSIHFRGLTVGGPSCMTDPAAAVKSTPAVDLLRKIDELSGRLDDLGDLFTVAYRYSC